ncbi:MAG: hypothetical protein U0931_30455 [Vulcanimicrobiota bacterium]
MNPYSALPLQVLQGRTREALRQLCLQGELGCTSAYQTELSTLEELGLARGHLLGWTPTWLGHGLNNWHHQQELARLRDPEAPAPEPNSNENGHHPVGDCGRFRETYFRPGFCWCCRPRQEHRDQLAEIALAWLHHHKQQARREKLQSPAAAARPLGPLCAQLSATEGAVVQLLRESRLGLGELALRLAPLWHYFQIKAAVDRLLELELLLDDGDQLVSSWEGRRVASWLGQPDASGRAQPGFDENGVDPTARACAGFRPVNGSRCWCGWSRKDHLSRESA